MKANMSKRKLINFQADLIEYMGEYMKETGNGLTQIIDLLQWIAKKILS